MQRTLPPLTLAFLFLPAAPHVDAGDDIPSAVDQRLTVELFCEHPQIVTPTGIDVDARGRVFVAESHTHFRPADYDGPAADRILVFEDTNGDGRADRRTVFHEGFTHIMDIEFAADGALYVATRMNIHRLRDTDGDGAADEIQPIVLMETAGTYPHNGLSGLAFDFRGDLHFGLGENLGHDYTLVGTDGTKLSGGGEGGSTYHVRADGSGLRRVSTGWWNPFGMCVDAFGRVFGTDNDPGASPPCRLIQVVEGADYGYEYRYGRTGLHPLITWTGDVPGTLPMVAGTGEAPCAVIAYESDAFPAEYRGNLLVASWADHRIERYAVKQTEDSGLVTTERQPFVEGGNEFRPVGLAIAPDGTLYLSDWVSSSYTLHKLGRIWRVRPTADKPHERPAEPRAAIVSRHRALREAAAKSLAASEAGRQVLRGYARNHATAQVRAAALQALAAGTDPQCDFASIATADRDPAVRRLALQLALENGTDPAQWAGPELPPYLRAEAVEQLTLGEHVALIASAVESPDPVVFHAAIEAASRRLHDTPAGSRLVRERHELAWLLAAKRNPELRAKLPQQGLERHLVSSNPSVRYAAVKWIADDQLDDYRPQLQSLLESRDLNLQLFLATSAALDRLDGKEPQDLPSPDVLLAKIQDAEAPTPIRALSLRLIDPAHSSLKVEILTALVSHADQSLRAEALATLAQHPHESKYETLATLANNQDEAAELRAAAVMGLASAAGRYSKTLTELAANSEPSIRDEALRALVGVDLQPAAKRALSELGQRRPELQSAVDRVLTGSPGVHPPNHDLAAWSRLLNDSGNRAAGERIFFGKKIGSCARCHRVDGRGNAVGPDLTKIRQRVAGEADGGKAWLLETILQPSLQLAPQYTAWMIVTTDGRTLTGLPRRKGGNAEAYLGIDGREFVVKKEEIDFHHESRVSIMPEDLLKNLTRQELNDLFAYLMQDE